MRPFSATHARRPAAARGHLQHPQGRARRRPAQAARDPQPRARRRGAGRRPRVPAGGAAASTAATRAASSAPGSAGPTRRRPTSWRPRATTSPIAPTRSRATASTATRCCRAGRSATSATTTCRTTASSSAACCTCRCSGTGTTVHAIVAHLGLMHAGRVRQVQRLARFIDAHVPRDELLIVAGDFNDWGERLDAPMRADGPAIAPPDRASARRCAHVPVARAGVLARPHLHARLALHVDLRAARRGLGAHVRPPAAGGRAGARLMTTAARWRARRARAARFRWPVATFLGGNDVELLRGGDELFPAMREAIGNALHEVWLATYIFHDDPAACALADALAEAARRGVRVRVVVDGFGSKGALQVLRKRLDGSGVALAVFRPVDRWWQLLQPEPVPPPAPQAVRRRWRRRLRRRHQHHRRPQSTCTTAGARRRASTSRCACAARWSRRSSRRRARCGARLVRPRPARRGDGHRAQRRAGGRRAPHAGTACASACRGDPLLAAAAQDERPVRCAFVVRDNLRQRRSIERSYIDAIRSAQRARRPRVAVLLSRAASSGARLRDAARRGVRVRLLLQGKLDYRIAGLAAQVLYDELLRLRRAHLRVHAGVPACQGGAGRRRLGHGRQLEHRPAVAAAEPGGERDRARPRLHRRSWRASSTPRPPCRARSRRTTSARAASGAPRSAASSPGARTCTCAWRASPEGIEADLKAYRSGPRRSGSVPRSRAESRSRQ